MHIRMLCLSTSRFPDPFSRSYDPYHIAAVMTSLWLIADYQFICRKSARDKANLYAELEKESGNLTAKAKEIEGTFDSLVSMPKCF